MQIRITIPLLQYGAVQWTKDQIAIVPDELGRAFIDSKEAVLVPVAEHATLPEPQHAVVPRPYSKPKPPATKRRR